MRHNDATAAFLASCLTAVACGGSAEPSSSAALEHVQADCIVAEIDGVKLTPEHVGSIQAAIQPTPGKGAAARLMIDAALSHVAAGRSLTGSNAREWLDAYRDLYAKSTQEAQGGRPIDVVLERLAKAKALHGFIVGDCDVKEERT